MLKTIDVVIVKDPKISAKLLCEYAEASAMGRNGIIKSCKIKDPRVITISKRYNPAQDFISDCLEHSFDFIEILKNYAADLRKESKKISGKKADNLLLCAEALEKFYKMEMVTKRVFGKYTINNTSHLQGRKVMINAVAVSVRPEMMLSLDSGGTEVGFIKLCFSKTKEIKNSIAHGIAAIGRLYFSEVKNQDFKSENCYVIDVFANKIHIAPKSDKRILEGYRACCSEIADRWDKIL
jgi:hypothetical protein